ncbi:DUF58 domain-containing protein [Kineosporia babensis]|uniref:DUF58 domain-containing protein n=1 Tax=Kineosporia babensis TaxID=499548 RepID=A0A9X1NNW5_9ACTN|nr:DUF58 domain-containing protein [Kineosporia babensis]MCD5316518.1 DUF58 domain-containing protein [Kineosporia babensis]
MTEPAAPQAAAGPARPMNGQAVDLGRIRLSPAGRALVAVAVAGLLAGFVVGYVELIGIACAAALLVLVAVAQVVARVSVQVERSISPQRVGVGEKAIGMLHIRIKGRGRAMRAVDQVGGRKHEIPVPSGSSGELRRVVYDLDTSRRGVFAVGPLRLHQHDLCEIAHRQRELGDTLQLIVRPKTYPLNQPAQGQSRDLEGSRTNSHAENGVTFSGLREYVPGDDLRIIHWKGLARGGPLTVRTHVDSSRSDILILLDDRVTSYRTAEDFEQAVSFAASVATMALAAAVTVRISPVSGRGLAGSAQAILDGLAGITVAEPDSAGHTLASAAQRTTGQGGRTAVAVLGPGAQSELSALVPLRKNWATVLAAVIDSGRSAQRPVEPGVAVLSEATAADLAASWNRRWG